MQTTGITIDLNSDTFVPADSQELAERLRAETDLLVQSEVAAYATVEGFPLPPDVALYILHTLAPLAAGVYLNVLSSALWDTVKAAFSRQGKDISEVTFSIVKVDEEGQMIHEVSGRTSDPDLIKDLIRRASEEDDA
jgi:hypothetical protein